MKQDMISNKFLLVWLLCSALGRHLDEGIQHAESLRGCVNRMWQGGNTEGSFGPVSHFLCQAAHTDPFLQGQSTARCGGAPSRSNSRYWLLSSEMLQIMVYSTLHKSQAGLTRRGSIRNIMSTSLIRSQTC